MDDLTTEQARVLIQVDSALRVYVLEADLYGEIVKDDVRRDLRHLREAFPQHRFWQPIP